ncbi:uncharacterized protein TNCV_3706141 [Trichonephila clavipes]|nr:uncharacterized protein TNCV_3706141 [Trichonephila clavipes]
MILVARTGLGSTQRQKIKAIAEEPSLATSAAPSTQKERGRTIRLMSGLIAIGTVLGFSLMGKSSQEVNDNTEGIFDPLRILTGATLLPKIWFQEAWKVKLAWDRPLPLGLCNKFDKWFIEILLLQNPQIPRYCEMISDSYLNVFEDASKNAYAACIFVMTKLASAIKLRLVRAKARVAPTKSVSRTRLEILDCCVGARFANSIKLA